MVDYILLRLLAWEIRFKATQQHVLLLVTDQATNAFRVSCKSTPSLFRIPSYQSQINLQTPLLGLNIG